MSQVVFTAVLLLSRQHEITSNDPGQSTTNSMQILGKAANKTMALKLLWKSRYHRHKWETAMLQLWLQVFMYKTGHDSHKNLLSFSKQTRLNWTLDPHVKSNHQQCLAFWGAVQAIRSGTANHMRCVIAGAHVCRIHAL